MAGKKLTDEQVYGRLHKALLDLGEEAGVSTVGDTALKTARRSLVLLQMSIVKAAEDDQVPILKDPAES